MDMSDWVKIIEALAWPITILTILALSRKQLISILNALTERIKAGAELETPWFSVSAIPSNLEAPQKDEPVTENHMALIHSSWRYPKKDKEFGRPMYAIHVVIQAPDSVLDRIEYVRYHLHPSYPNPIQTMTDRNTRFKLKELAWGEYTLRAEVKVKGQDEEIKLSRYINLTETGPRI
jgi:hypothetical protein